MSETEHLAFVADIPVDLAAIVVHEAGIAGLPLRTVRASDTRKVGFDVRCRIAARARAARFQWWQIGRAINRDHASAINAARKVAV